MFHFLVLGSAGMGWWWCAVERNAVLMLRTPIDDAPDSIFFFASSSFSYTPNAVVPAALLIAF